MRVFVKIMPKLFGEPDDRKRSQGRANPEEEDDEDAPCKKARVTSTGVDTSTWTDALPTRSDTGAKATALLDYALGPSDKIPPREWYTIVIEGYRPKVSGRPCYTIHHQLRTQAEERAEMLLGYIGKWTEGGILLSASEVRSIAEEPDPLAKNYLRQYLESPNRAVVKRQRHDRAISAARVEARIAAALKIEWSKSHVKELRSPETSLTAPIIERPTAMDVDSFIRKVRTLKVEINPRGADRSS
ncbi:hypothetical protein GGI17_006314 [Coemansia sp. S146]|nr:hypothetical protein GGI17_006314 [Coemansia sp. S146]